MLSFLLRFRAGLSETCFPAVLRRKGWSDRGPTLLRPVDRERCFWVAIPFWRKMGSKPFTGP